MLLPCLPLSHEAPCLLPYLCREASSAPCVTLVPFPWFHAFCPFPVFGIPSLGFAIPRVTSYFLSRVYIAVSFSISPAAWMPAEGALIAPLPQHRCSRPVLLVQVCRTISRDVRALLSSNVVSLQQIQLIF